MSDDILRIRRCAIEQDAKLGLMWEQVRENYQRLNDSGAATTGELQTVWVAVGSLIDHMRALLKQIEPKP